MGKFISLIFLFKLLGLFLFFTWEFKFSEKKEKEIGPPSSAPWAFLFKPSRQASPLPLRW